MKNTTANKSLPTVDTSLNLNFQPFNASFKHTYTSISLVSYIQHEANVPVDAIIGGALEIAVNTSN